MSRTRVLLVIAVCIAITGVVRLVVTRQSEALHSDRTNVRNRHNTKLTYDFSVPVLMYHHVSQLPPEQAQNRLLRDLTVSPYDFDQQMRYLAEHGYTAINTDEIVQAMESHKPLPEKSVALTFDDGYKDFATVAVPILRKYGFTATSFPVGMMIGKPGHLSESEIERANKEGFTFGSHTIHHLDLTAVPNDQLRYELSASKDELEQLLKKQVVSIAYPDGQTNAIVAEAAGSAGYKAAWMKYGGPVRPNCSLYYLPRIRIDGDISLAAFAEIVTSASAQ